MKINGFNPKVLRKIRREIALAQGIDHRERVIPSRKTNKQMRQVARQEMQNEW